MKYIKYIINNVDNNLVCQLKLYFLLLCGICNDIIVNINNMINIVIIISLVVS